MQKSDCHLILGVKKYKSVCSHVKSTILWLILLGMV